MSGTPYLDGDTLEEARNAHRQGITLAAVASQLQCDEWYLANLLGLPQRRQTQGQDPDCEPMDLLRADFPVDENEGES